jgi:hypothetical protein
VKNGIQDVKYADSPSDYNVCFHNERNLQLDVVVSQGGSQLRVGAVHLTPDLNRSSIANSHHWSPYGLQRDLKLKWKNNI